MPNRQSKKIIMASPFFYPEPISTAKYNTFLVKKLVEEKHEVIVMAKDQKDQGSRLQS